MSRDNLTNYFIRKTHSLSVCFILLKTCKKRSGVFSFTAGIPSCQRCWNERREIQSVTMHAGLCDATYCLVSVKKRAQRLYGHVARKKTTCRLCSLLSLTRRLRNTG